MEALIRTAPIDQEDKDRISREIKDVESAIFTAYTPVKSTKTSPKKHKNQGKT